MTTTTPADVLAAEIKRLAGEYAHCYAFVGDGTMPIKHRELHAAIDRLREMAEGAHVRCRNCDDSGDVTNLEGEWRGYCFCPAGTALMSAPVAAKQAEPDGHQVKTSTGAGSSPIDPQLGTTTPAAVAPDGWVMVPREPTERMQIEGALAHQNSVCHDHIGPIDDAWAAMLKEAPKPPASTDRAMGAEGRVPLTDARHPMQPLVSDEQGVTRFRRNKIVDYLLEWARPKGMGLNELSAIGFDDDEWQQLTQLIGYSLSGWGTLSFVDDAAWDRAQQLSTPPSGATSAEA